MQQQDMFLGETEEPEAKKSKEEEAFERRQKQKSDRMEKLTKDINNLVYSHPDAYKILIDYIEMEIYALGFIMAQANDSDMLLKYSGGIKILREMQEKLEVFNDFS